jgi:hypothetical protein
VIGGVAATDFCMNKGIAVTTGRLAAVVGICVMHR